MKHLKELKLNEELINSPNRIREVHDKMLKDLIISKLQEDYEATDVILANPKFDEFLDQRLSLVWNKLDREISTIWDDIGFIGF